MKRSNPTARMYEYGGTATAEQQSSTRDQDMATILEQCANAMLQGQRQQQERQAQFEAQMAANMTTLQGNLQAQIANSTNQQQQLMNAAAQQVRFAQQPQQQQPTQNWNTNPTTGNWRNQAWQGMQQQGATLCPPAFQQQNNRQQTAKNPFRVYENGNYCWTHGHHVQDDHTSATCTMPDPGHQHATTKTNTIGGSNAGSHKTIMPSQSGRTRITKPQPPPTKAYQAWRAAGCPQPKGQFMKQFKAQNATQQPMQQMTQQPMQQMWGVAPNAMNNMQWGTQMNNQWQQQGMGMNKGW